MSNESGYSAIAVDHATRPRNMGPLSKWTGHAQITGPCGDTMAFWVLVEDDQVGQVSFVTDGCGSSLACGSMTTVLAQGKPLAEAAAIQQTDVLRALDGFPEAVQHCALLAATTLHAACEDHARRSGDAEGSLLSSTLRHVARPLKEMLGG